jgi:hypothetical protein
MRKKVRKKREKFWGETDFALDRTGAREYTMGMLKEEFQYYDSHQDEIVLGHIGDYVVVKNKRILGYFGAETEAFSFMASNKEAPGTFLVHKCQDKGTDTITYHTRRVRFA